MSRLTFFILCLEGSLLSFNVAAAAALVPSIAHDFAISPFIAGRIVWLYMLPYGFTALLYGPLARAWDAKKIEFWCLLFFSLANLIVGLAQDIQSVFIGRFFMGVFGASVIPLGLILISHHIEAKERGKYVGLFFGSTFVASLAGLFLSGIISWRMIFIIPAGLGLVLCLGIQAYLPSFKNEKGSFRINYLSALKDKRVAGLFAYILLISIFYHGIQQWLGVYFDRKFSFNQLTISMLITLTSLSGIFGEGFGGLLSDKIGRLKTVNLGLALMILGIFLLLFKAPLLVLSLVMIVWGLGWTFNHAGLSTMLTDLPKEFLNEVASLNSSVRFTCGGIGAFLGGMLMQKSLNLWIMVFGICLLILLISGRKKPCRI